MKVSRATSFPRGEVSLRVFYKVLMNCYLSDLEELISQQLHNQRAFHNCQELRKASMCRVCDANGTH